MEIVGLVSAILLALLIVALAHTIFTKRNEIPYYRPIRDKFKRKAQPLLEPTQRMFVAIRRQPAGRTAMMSLPEEEYERSKSELIARFALLHEHWSSAAVYKWGFHGSEYGLPSTVPEEGWILFACYMVPDHKSYRYCYEIMQSKHFISLHNQFDIRLLYGEQMNSLVQNADELFRRVFR